MSNVVYLHGRPPALAHFVRVGSQHRQLEQLHASGRLGIERFVFSAGRLNQQQELLTSLQQSGHELSLDTNVAELSATSQYKTSVRNAPWANTDGVLTPAHILDENQHPHGLIRKIAQTAVRFGFHRVQAPTHLLLQGDDPWQSVDRRACELLRKYLDDEGGRKILIDYPLIAPKSVFDDVVQRRMLLDGLRDLPIESIWLRISSFGSASTGVSIRKYILDCGDAHLFGIPLVSDHVGGLAAIALAAFGAVAGSCHGVGRTERFDASGWNKLGRKPKGGSSQTILLPGLDRLVTREVADAIMNASGGRRLLSCNIPGCCAGGYENTVRDPKSHYFYHRVAQMAELSALPELRRSQHFVDKMLTPVERRSREATRLRGLDEKVMNLVFKSSERLDRMRSVLDNLNRAAVIASRSRIMPLRSAETNQATSTKRG